MYILGHFVCKLWLLQNRAIILMSGRGRHLVLRVLYKSTYFPTLISIQVLLKALTSLFAPKLLFIEVFGVSVQLYIDLDF